MRGVNIKIKIISILLLLIILTSSVIYILVKNQEVNVKNSIFTKEKIESIDKDECYIRNTKEELTTKDLTKLFKILSSMELKEYSSEDILYGIVIQLDITEKNGYKYSINILSKTITVDGQTFYTDADYVEEIENALK